MNSPTRRLRRALRWLCPAGLIEARQASRQRAADAEARAAVHFLHIGKAGGNQIRFMLDRVSRRGGGPRFVTHGHRTALCHLPPAQWFFAIRHPVSRFVSAFYSRKRQAMPRTFNPWSESEKIAYSQFEHASDLAEALFDQSTRGDHAFKAMSSIVHTAMRQTGWIEPIGYFLEVRPPVHIIRQEQLEADMNVLFRCLDIDPVPPTKDPVTAHANDYNDAPPLSATGIANLERWYAPDLQFYQCCVKWIDAREA